MCRLDLRLIVGWMPGQVMAFEGLRAADFTPSASAQ